MSDVRLVVRELDRDWSGTVHGSDADRAIAALSADPVTLEELEAALGRFARPIPGRRHLSNLRPGLCDEPHDAGLVVIDLAARLIAVESTYSSPIQNGCEYYHNGECATNIAVRFWLADDWLILDNACDWKAVAKARRTKRAARPPLDARAVFYGRPMIEFLARGAFAAFARRDEYAAAMHREWAEDARKRLARAEKIAPEQIDAARLTDEEIPPKCWSEEDRPMLLYSGAIKEVHAAWLLAPRDDLGGLCPREVAVDRHDHLSHDMQDRCHQWSTMGGCPPGLDESSHAYRFGGFGTHELVKYYDLVRELLHSTWTRLTELADAPDADRRFRSMTAGDFLIDEVPRLEQIRDAWFDEPDDECHSRTPRSIIDRERARLPEGMSARDHMIDPDCPCCQMMADLPGPMFWHLDGSGMDDDFAFDFYRRTREEWETEQREREEFNRKFDAEWDEKERLGVSESERYRQGASSLWSRSYSIADEENVPLGMRIFGIGCRLAELIVELRAGAERSAVSPETQQWIDQLNCRFANLRDVLQSDDPSLSAALIEPVIQRFDETLESLAAEHMEIDERCMALSQELRQLLEPAPPEPEWTPGDFDVPF